MNVVLINTLSSMTR